MSFPNQNVLVIDASFPDRTSAMINTLKRIEKLKEFEGFIGKIFLIAGIHHLEEAKLCNLDGIISEKLLPSEYSLSALYEELKTRKVIILKSKFAKKNHKKNNH